ncbi:hypothetical protein H671_2g4716 [Cricetulus griseus]|nr:hypothetical protein H671_2g4716 [Cricetulus griseus]
MKLPVLSAQLGQGYLGQIPTVKVLEDTLDALWIQSFQETLVTKSMKLKDERLCGPCDRDKCISGKKSYWLLKTAGREP